MNFLKLSSFLALSLCFLPIHEAGADHHQKIKILYMGGRDHDWKGYQEAIVPLFKKQGDFELTLSNKLDDLKAGKIKDYDVVLFFGSGGNFTDPAQESGLEEYLRNGGGIVGVHATDAFKKSDAYWKIFGGQFIGHGGGTFRIVFTDKKHPITKGMESFEIHDESYRDKMHPATKDKLHHLGRIDRGKENHSMIWVHEYGKGRLFNTGLGHDKKAWDNPALQKMVVRAIYWAAKKPVKDPK